MFAVDRNAAVRRSNGYLIFTRIGCIDGLGSSACIPEKAVARVTCIEQYAAAFAYIGIVTQIGNRQGPQYHICGICNLAAVSASYLYSESAACMCFYSLCSGTAWCPYIGAAYITRIQRCGISR